MRWFLTLWAALVLGIGVASATHRADHGTEVAGQEFSCFKEAITATTECQAAPTAPSKLYVTGLVVSNQAATVQTVDLVSGTGTNCGTSTTALTHKIQMGTNATTTSPFVASVSFPTPIRLLPGHAVCPRPSAATAFGVTITGYIGQ